jgi:DNA-binding YbaB/EbfC family protein
MRGSGPPLKDGRGMNIQKLLQLGQQMQSQLSEIQETLGSQEVSASSGGGMVTVVVDGKGEVKRVSIDPAVVDPADVEMLEDLILAAIAEAQTKAHGFYEAEMKKVAVGLPFPMKLPGLF